jgi:hypothetical protein
VARLLALVGSRFCIPETHTDSLKLFLLPNIELVGRQEIIACKIISN